MTSRYLLSYNLDKEKKHLEFKYSDGSKELIDLKKEKWGFLRETKEKAIKEGTDQDTGLHRTGLDEYLQVIFPETFDWIHDKQIANLPKEESSKRRPDYRSESLKLIIEFDGVQHYEKPQKIREDMRATDYYQRLGYKVVRIPFFIQLSNDVVKQLFGVTVSEHLFNEEIPSMGLKGTTPAMLCNAGVMRMAEEFKNFPKQYQVNLDSLNAAHDDFMTGASLLKKAYDNLAKEKGLM